MMRTYTQWTPFKNVQNVIARAMLLVQQFRHVSSNQDFSKQNADTETKQENMKTKSLKKTT